MIIIIYYVIEIVPSLASGKSFRLGCILLTCLSFFFSSLSTSLSSGVTRYCKLILYFFSSSPGTSHVSREPWFFSVSDGI